MKRYLIAIAALGLVLGVAGKAFADNNWAFDHAYWKEPPTVKALRAEQPTPVHSPYYQVDDFNP